MARQRTTSTRAGAIAFLSLLLALSGCVDAPSMSSPSTIQSDPLAETFDALSRVAGEYGDLARSDGFAFAALSVRSGVTPSRLEVQTEAAVEAYDAFVNASEWESSVPVAMRPPARRTLVGWRKTSDGATRILMLTAPGDSSAIVSPIVLGPGSSTVAVFNAASAMQNEGKDAPSGKPEFSSAWYGSAGWVRLKEVATIGPCPDSSKVARTLGISRCDEMRYLVRFDLSMQRMSGRPPQLVPGSPTRRVFNIGEPVVNGIKSRFACMAPSSERGCR